MNEAFSRTVSLIGEQAFDRIACAHVLVVGLGGVGGAALNVLARSGVGELTLVDGDSFELSNLNRQQLCTLAVIGRNKAEVAREYVLSINASAKAHAVGEYLSRDNVERILDVKYSYCVDAIDDIKNKTELIVECKRRGIPVISAMGAGNRTDCGFSVVDVYKTQNDPLARKLRRELRDRGVPSLDAVCATSPPDVKSGTPLSIAAPPIVMGAIMANRVVAELSKNR